MTLNQLSLAIQRFINQKGKTQLFYSDNAPQIKAFQVLHPTDFEWDYITPLTLWEGSIYEVLVGFTKRTLKQALGRKLFPYHELATAILNTRPLCYVGSTPGRSFKHS